MTYTHKMVDGVRVDLTDKEIKELQAQDVEWGKGKSARDLLQLRRERNNLLAETDWMSLPDAPTMSDAWKKYRQNLRDITKTYKSMSDNGFSFPTKPTE